MRQINLLQHRLTLRKAAKHGDEQKKAGKLNLKQESSTLQQHEFARQQRANLVGPSNHWQQNLRRMFSVVIHPDPSFLHLRTVNL